MMGCAAAAKPGMLKSVSCALMSSVTGTLVLDGSRMSLIWFSVVLAAATARSMSFCGLR